MSLSVFTAARMIKEFYTIGCLSDRERAKYYLIRRYEDKVSPHLRAQADDLLAKGEDALREIFRGLTYSDCSLFMPIPKKK